MLLPPEGRRGKRGECPDERQEDLRDIRGVTQATCLWVSARWYGMAPSSSGAILSMSAWFRRLEGWETRDSVQEKEELHLLWDSVARDVRFSTDLFFTATKLKVTATSRLHKQHANKAG